MSKRIKIILNPITNHGRSEHVAETLKTKLDPNTADWVVTEYPGHTIPIARESAEQGYDLVIAAGGDGTVHEVINGLMQIPEDQRPVLGILPLGSGNDFSHIIGLPEDPWEALQTCLNGAERYLDIGSVTDENGRCEYFNNTIGIGFDGVVTIHTKRIKKIHGFMMYLVATLRTVFRDFTPMKLTVTTDRESWSQPTIMLTVGNGPREGGGFLVTPDAKVDDGIFHYATIGEISRLTMLRLIPEVMNGTHARYSQVRMGTCRTMQISSKQPLYAHCDGEIYSGFEDDLYNFNIQILPDAIRVMS